MKYLLLLLSIACTSNNIEKSKFLFVADHLVSCEGVGPQQCMLIKENIDHNWTYYYDQIEGFDYEQGFNYEILVNVISIAHPAADAADVKYVLKEVISKVASDGKSDLIGSWKVIKISGLDEVKIIPTMKFEAADNKVAGFAGCNNYFSSYTVKGQELSFGNTGATRMLCPDMTTEDLFLTQLAKVARYEVNKRELYLYDSNDSLLILLINSD